MTTFKTTLHHLKLDYKRRVQLERATGVLSKLAILTKPGMVGVACYRFSHYLAQGRLRHLCRFFLLIEHLYARNEISPYTTIGPGLVLGDVGAIGIPDNTLMGKNCTLLGFNTLTLNAIAGIDFTVDKIELGDHCVLGSRAKIMRPIKIADGVQIKDNSLVMVSMNKVGATLAGVPAKRKRIDDYDHIVQWNPFLGGMLN